MDEVFAVVTDLFFVSRIQSAAAAAGVPVRFVRPDGLIPEHAPRLALVDLDASVDVRAAIRQLKAVGTGSIVAFGPHLDTESRKAARAAGAHRVLAKSKFVTDLPTMLASLTPTEGA
jgi:hypothetical protein